MRYTEQMNWLCAKMHHALSDSQTFCINSRVFFCLFSSNTTFHMTLHKPEDSLFTSCSWPLSPQRSCPDAPARISKTVKSAFSAVVPTCLLSAHFKISPRQKEPSRPVCLSTWTCWQRTEELVKSSELLNNFAITIDSDSFLVNPEMECHEPFLTKYNSLSISIRTTLRRSTINDQRRHRVGVGTWSSKKWTTLDVLHSRLVLRLRLPLLRRNNFSVALS
eukprot:g9037.t1